MAITTTIVGKCEQVLFTLSLCRYVYCEDCMMRTHDTRYVDYIHKTQVGGIAAGFSCMLVSHCE